MSDAKTSKIGQIVWRDLTVPDAATVKDFYCDVVGWEASVHDEPGCRDFDIRLPGSDEVVAGVCWAEGSNKGVPPQWLVYVTVESVEESIARCEARGGKVIDGPRQMGAQAFCVIQDPAGAYLGLIEG